MARWFWLDFVIGPIRRLLGNSRPGTGPAGGGVCRGELLCEQHAALTEVNLPAAVLRFALIVRYL